MDNAIVPIGILCGFLVALAFFGGFIAGNVSAMQEAGSLGYAVQCKGITGWHWECPDKSE